MVLIGSSLLRPAACSAAGPASERLEVVPLPEPVAWEKISRWVRNFSYEGQSGRIERCLFTAYHKGDADKLSALLFECAVEPHFIDAPDIPLYVSYLAEVVDEFGWETRGGVVLLSRSPTRRTSARMNS